MPVGYELIINMFVGNKRVQNNRFIKNDDKISIILTTLFVKTTDFQLVFNFDAYSYHIWRAKPIRALELYYPLIQFLIKGIIRKSISNYPRSALRNYSPFAHLP